MICTLARTTLYRLLFEHLLVLRIQFFFELFLFTLATGLTSARRTAFIGIKSFDAYDLAELADYIDWTPFFQTWELAGRFPAILSDPKVGEVARSLYDDARKMLDLIIKEKWFKARATIGFWPANADGDDIALYADESRKQKIATLHTLRQQLEKREGRFNAALSDFIAPAGGAPDYIGGFVVTAGIGEDAVADRFKNANDDYSSILCKALADRLAEAFAERMHQRVRKEFWGYAPDEALAADQLILEQYAGIRPAPGYPAQPDHTEKQTLFALLDAENTAGVKLTESFAMWPGSSVSGLYFASPDSFVFIAVAHRISLSSVQKNETDHCIFFTCFCPRYDSFGRCTVRSRTWHRTRRRSAANGL